MNERDSLMHRLKFRIVFYFSYSHVGCMTIILFKEYLQKASPRTLAVGDLMNGTFQKPLINCEIFLQNLNVERYVLNGHGTTHDQLIHATNDSVFVY